MKSIVFSALALVACGSTFARGQDCCEQCGCQSCCRKVCRLVCETKKVPKVTYGCECEDFCVPGPSDHCVTCDECGNKKHVYSPTCAQVRTRKKLIKHETMEEVPTHRWVVETICDSCANQCATQAAPDVHGVSRLPMDHSDVRKASFERSGSEGAGSSSPGPGAQSPGLTSQIRRMLTPPSVEK